MSSIDFIASNNEAEYEAVVAGLKLDDHLGAKNLELHSDSQLIVSQIRGEYFARDKIKASYLTKVKQLLQGFDWNEVTHIPRTENEMTDKLAKLASGMEDEDLGRVPIERLAYSSVDPR